MRRRREWDDHTRMDAEKLVKISRDNIPVGRRSPGRPKRIWSDLNPRFNRRIRQQTKKNKKKFNYVRPLDSVVASLCTYQEVPVLIPGFVVIFILNTRIIPVFEWTGCYCYP